MSTKKAFVGLLGAAMLSLSLPAAAGATTVAEQARTVTAPQPQAALDCKKSVGNTGGWVECKGKGTWRVKSICDSEPDKYTTWHSQRGGTQRIYAEQCTFDISDVTWEVK